MSLRIIVEGEDVQLALTRAEEGVKLKLPPLIVKDLEREVRAEAEPVSRRLGAPWFIEGGGEQYKLLAPEWWAHFLARGTREHGATGADFLQFVIDGDWVRAYTVRGIAANPFDERAAERTAMRANALLEQAIGGLP